MRLAQKGVKSAARKMALALAVMDQLIPSYSRMTKAETKQFMLRWKDVRDRVGDTASP